jgi:alkylated DNA repair dioxygenase AlkB
VEKMVDEKFNVCVVQRYPNGSYGINPHKDKEMIIGTTICGISFGAKRKLRLHSPKYMKLDNIELDLEHGSLYVLKSPTNTYWSHEIVKDKNINKPRISLTFRNYSTQI